MKPNKNDSIIPRFPPGYNFSTINNFAVMLKKKINNYCTMIILFGDWLRDLQNAFIQ